MDIVNVGFDSVRKRVRLCPGRFLPCGERHSHQNLRPLTLSRAHAHGPTENCDSLAHAKQAEATAAGIAREADSVFFDAELHLLRSRFKLNPETLAGSVVQFTADPLAFFFLSANQMPRQLRISRFWRGQFVRRSSLAGTGPARHLRHLKARVSGLTRGLSGWDCVNFPVKSHSNNNSPQLPQLPNTKRRVSDDPWFQRFARAIGYNPKAMLRYFTSGESHGEALVAFLSGLPAGVEVDQAFLDRELWRRQQGYGRGGRMKIETDKAHVLSGVRHGKTIGSPIAIQIMNRDWKNWEEKLPVETGDPAKHQTVASPRPGHADLAGALKHNFPDARYVLARAPARESTA